MSTLITRSLPNAVIYDLTHPSHTKITLPRGSTWSSGLHWHETHTEYLRVLQGSVRVRLGETLSIVSVSKVGDNNDPVDVKVDPYRMHEWSRADPDGEEVVVVERTDPVDGEKRLFFWNLNGVVLKAQGAEKPWILPGWVFRLMMDLWVTLNLFVIFHSLDNFPVLLDIPEILQSWGYIVRDGSLIYRLLYVIEMHLSRIVLMTISLLGWVVGLEPVRREFTTEIIYQEWRRSQQVEKAS